MVEDKIWSSPPVNPYRYIHKYWLNKPEQKESRACRGYGTREGSGKSKRRERLVYR
jgi:hypothetical protein